MNKKITTLLFVSAAVLILLPTLAKASEIKSGNHVYLPQGETIDGNLYAASNNITIEGEIKGDLIAAAQTITVNGRIEGDLIAAAQTITVNGEINGSIRLAGNSANLNGPIARNINFIGNSLNIGKEAKIGWDVLSGAANTEIMGLVNGSVYGGGNNLMLSGKIGKDVHFTGDENIRHITLSPEAIINGNLNYNEKTEITLQPGATVAGEMKAVSQKTEKNISNLLWSWLYRVFAALIMGLIWIGVGKKLTISLQAIIKKQPLASLGWGIISFLVIPVIALVLVFTLIGIPLALALMSAWLVTLMFSKVLSAILLGKEISRRIIKDQDSHKNWLISLVIGVIVAWALFALPFIGWLVSLIAICFGFGAILLLLRQHQS
jgi:cytoskeletal protein CcmA (bactofilin family)